MKITKYLTVTSGGDARITANRPKPRFGEATYRLLIDVPNTWNQIVGDINIDMPEPPPATVTLEGDVLG